MQILPQMHCIVVVVIPLSYVVVLESVLLGCSSSSPPPPPPPPFRAPLGVSFFCGFCSLLWVLPCRRCGLGCQPSPPTGCCLSGGHLSLQMLPPSLWVSPSLFLVFTGPPRVFQFIENIFWCTTLDTSSVLFPGVTGCFGSYNRHPRPGDSTEADQTPACVQVAFYSGSDWQIPCCPPLLAKTWSSIHSSDNTPPVLGISPSFSLEPPPSSPTRALSAPTRSIVLWPQRPRWCQVSIWTGWCVLEFYCYDLKKVDSALGGEISIFLLKNNTFIVYCLCVSKTLIINL